MNKEIIICVGCSGAGKSSWTTQFIKDNPNYLRINRDSIRLTLVGDLDGYYQRKDLNSIEMLVNQVEESLFYKIYNNAEYNLILDNTHLKQSYINRWFKIFEDYELATTERVNFKFKLFDIELEEAKDRVACRDFPIDIDLNDLALSYIDKQYQDYQNIKAWLLNNYKDKII